MKQFNKLEQMTERVLRILRRQSKRICCVFDGELLDGVSLETIKLLLEQIEEIGSVRRDIAIFDRQLKPETYSMYINCGISPIIVPSDKDVYLALEILDIVNGQQTDILCLGVKDEVLLPVTITARETTDILLVTQTKQHAENFLPYTDFLIVIDDIIKQTSK